MRSKKRSEYAPLPSAMSTSTPRDEPSLRSVTITYSPNSRNAHPQPNTHSITVMGELDCPEPALRAPPLPTRKLSSGPMTARTLERRVSHALLAQMECLTSRRQQRYTHHQHYQQQFYRQGCSRTLDRFSGCGASHSGMGRKRNTGERRASAGSGDNCLRIRIHPLGDDDSSYAGLMGVSRRVWAWKSGSSHLPTRHREHTTPAGPQPDILDSRESESGSEAVPIPYASEY